MMPTFAGLWKGPNVWRGERSTTDSETLARVQMVDRQVEAPRGLPPDSWNSIDFDCSAARVGQPEETDDNPR
jgi:hypothetical protein